MEDKAKQTFDETVEKQGKLAKKIILGVLGGMGIFFTIAGTVFLCLEDAILNEIGLVFAIVGAFEVGLGVLLYFVIPTKYDYEKYKVRVKKYGYLNTFEINAKLAELEERIAELEKENNNKF